MEFSGSTAKLPCFGGEPIFPWSFQLDVFSTIITPTRMHPAKNLTFFQACLPYLVLFVYFLGLLCLYFKVERSVHEKVFKKDSKICNCVVE